MNIQNVAKREVLDYKQFRSKVMDSDFKPLAPENQDPESKDKTGLHVIKRQPAFDHIGYADAVFNPERAGISVPGYNDEGNRPYTNGVGVDLGQPNTVFNMDTSESLLVQNLKSTEGDDFSIKKISEL
jgi:hypothetical protein